MASWMVHLRIADRLLDQIPGLTPTEFIVGNIAPDSGVPNEDWSVFTPSTKISHFKTDGHSKAGPNSFASKYFTTDHQLSYRTEELSFYLGYLVHLLTDVNWSKRIVHPTKEIFAQQFAADPEGFFWKVKEDWYDLDHLYLKEHPDFRAFQIYSGAVGFENTYMDEFSSDAFDNRRAYITGFYLQGKEGLDREYPYLTKAEMNVFVEHCADEIFNELKHKYCDHFYM